MGLIKGDTRSYDDGSFEKEPNQPSPEQKKNGTTPQSPDPYTNQAC